MAEKKVKMSDAMAKRLKESGADIKTAEESLKKIEALGLDVSEMRDKLEWVKQTKKTLEEHFS